MKTSVLAVAAAALLVAGCSSTSNLAQTIEVTSENMAFSAREMTAEKGKPIKIVLNNKDAMLHDWAIDKIPAKVKESHGDSHAHGADDPAVHVAADAGKSGAVEFTPTEAGTYTYYCTVPGHKDSGMEGTLIIQ